MCAFTVDEDQTYSIHSCMVSQHFCSMNITSKLKVVNTSLTQSISAIFILMRKVVLPKMNTLGEICGIAGENRPTGAKFPMEIIDL